MLLLKCFGKSCSIIFSILKCWVFFITLCFVIFHHVTYHVFIIFHKQFHHLSIICPSLSHILFTGCSRPNCKITKRYKTWISLSNQAQWQMHYLAGTIVEPTFTDVHRQRKNEPEMSEKMHISYTEYIMIFIWNLYDWFMNLKFGYTFWWFFDIVCFSETRHSIFFQGDGHQLVRAGHGERRNMFNFLQ